MNDVVNALLERTEMRDPAPTETIDQPPLEVLESFRAGDVEALGAIFDRYSGPVTAVVRSVVGNQGHIEDAVQETFLRAWRGAGSYDPVRPIGPWLFTIARRTAIDVLRREGRPTRSDHDELSDDAVNSGGEGGGIEAAWETWEIRSALERLPAEEAMVLRLSHFNGMTHPQIAEHLGIPPGTVKSRSHRAHRRLVDLLGHLVEPVGESERGAR